MNRLESLRMQPGEIAAALDVTLSDIISWLAGEMKQEQCDMLEVGLSLLELKRMRRRQEDEPTLRLMCVRVA
jgi:hypothetical protein